MKNGKKKKKKTCANNFKGLNGMLDQIWNKTGNLRIEPTVPFLADLL